MALRAVMLKTTAWLLLMEGIGRGLKTGAFADANTQGWLSKVARISVSGKGNRRHANRTQAKLLSKHKSRLRHSITNVLWKLW